MTIFGDCLTQAQMSTDPFGDGYHNPVTVAIESNITPAFITGSHAYGTPHAASDVDIVMLMESSQWIKLAQLSGVNIESAKYGAPVIRYGNLNIIIAENRWEYDMWRQGTEKLVADSKIQGPVSRSAAKSLFRHLLKQDDPDKCDAY